jgi:hypothetical protein
MRAIELDYEVKTAYGNWEPGVLVTSDGKEYERAVNIIHQHPDEYRVVRVRHIEMESSHDENTEAGTDPIYEAYRILVNLRDGDENASLDDAIGLLGEALDD